MTPDRDNIRFNVLRNALYHTARRMHFERLNRMFNFAVVILGAGAMGDVFARIGVDLIWIGAAIAAIGALQLVLDFGRMARDHQQLQRDYYHLLAEIESAASDDPKLCAEWYAQMIRITADEPPVLRALDAKAFNDALDATEIYPRSERLVLKPRHMLLGWLFAFEGSDFSKNSEVATAKKS
ncbi:hypothetical protein [Stappia sp.]|uniref:hypothetical protein n=1 Tax=Stappia sp. TaxID=1870903 RepID=UPI003D12DD66